MRAIIVFAVIFAVCNAKPGPTSLVDLRQYLADIISSGTDDQGNEDLKFAFMLIATNLVQQCRLSILVPEVTTNPDSPFSKLVAETCPTVFDLLGKKLMPNGIDYAAEKMKFMLEEGLCLSVKLGIGYEKHLNSYGIYINLGPGTKFDEMEKQTLALCQEEFSEGDYEKLMKELADASK